MLSKPAIWHTYAISSQSDGVPVQNVPRHRPNAETIAVRCITNGHDYHEQAYVYRESLLCEPCHVWMLSQYASFYQAF